MKLGARILKTGIAITLALFIATLLQLPSPVFAGISAIFAIQPTIYRSYLSIIEQIQANVIGAVFAIIFGLIFDPHPVIIGLTAIIVIVINLKLKMENTISIALVTVIAILETPGEDFIQFALIRFFTVMLGIFAAFIVNLVFLPPKYETKLYNHILNHAEEIIKWTRISIRNATEYTILKDDIEKFKEQLIKVDHLYLLYKEERNYFKRTNYAKSRKLVLFRQMLITSGRSLDTLKKLHRFDNELNNMPEKFRSCLLEELEDLLNIHEELLLSFIGKIRTTPYIENNHLEKLHKKQLIEALMEFHQENGDDLSSFYHLLPLVATIIDYSEQLGHLDKLMGSFKSFHKEENEVNIPETE
ncbi:FUSC family protein [Metabacillus fastidiosus]|uniref:FUSC family protein n=1 Tax=Metabacillus fastidiosus TaxID=1458 RepID=UPI003D28FB58